MFRNIWSIAEKELRLFFLSFVAYVILFFFLLTGGYYFYIAVVKMGDAARIIPYFFQIWCFFSFIFTAFITMRVFSEEKRAGTIEFLITAPLTESEIVLGKFLGTFLFYMTYTAFTLLYLAALMLLGKPDFGPILTTYIGFILLEAAFISVGILISATTKNQIVSGLVTLVVLLFFWIVQWIASYAPGILQDILVYLSFNQHFQDFAKGIIDTKHIVFYLSVISVNLFLTIRLLENRKVLI